jgi:hypothetical protein
VVSRVSKVDLPRLEVLRDIRIQAPRGLEGALRLFYASCLGLPEEGEQAADPTRLVLTFSGQEYRLLVEVVDSAIDPGVRRRAVLVVKSLDEVEEALKDNRIAYVSERELAITGRRVFVTDPAGHRLEIRQTWPL